MLETIVARQVIFYVVGAVAAIGIIAKLVAGISLKRLVKASSNMSKSNHALMRLVRAKFEHACMVSDKVQNVGAFVDKYVYEYRVLGLRLHSWRRLETAAIWLYGIVSAVGAGLEYYVNGPGDSMYQYALVGAAGVVVLFLLHIMTDERYQLEAAKIYMVDFLENSYAHRYEKTGQKEIQVTVQKAEEERIAGQAVRPQPERVPVQEPEIRPAAPMEEPGTSPQRAPGGPEQPLQAPQPDSVPQPGTAVHRENIMQTESYDSGEHVSARSRGVFRQREDFESQRNQAQKPAVQMKMRIQQEHQAEPEVQAAASPYVETAGEPQNVSAYRDAGMQMQQGQAHAREEPAGQDMAKEAKIREILEEFLA